MYPDLAPVLLEALRREHFHHVPHIHIWDAIEAIFTETGTVSHELVLGLLDTRKQRHAVGGESYLAALFEKAAPVTQVLAEHVKLIKKDYQRRQFEHGAGKLWRIAKDTAHSNIDETLQGLRDIASDLISEEPQANGTPTGYDVPEAVTHVLKQLQESAEATEAQSVSSGIQELDNMTSGFHPGELIIIAARPGAGKTALALSMALSAIEKGESVLFFSLEMPLHQLWYRAISQTSGVPLQSFRSPKALTPSNWEDVHTTAGKLAGSKLVFDATATLTVEEIAIRARARQQKHGLGIVVVDYLQLVHVPNETFREQAVAHVSRSLKRLSLELGVPVIALSQLNRAVEQRNNRAPLLSDLRESGSIEQDADAVMFVHRPALWDSEAESSDAELIIAKQRNGPVGRLDIHFNETTTKFKGVDPYYNYIPTERDLGRQGDTEF